MAAAPLRCGALFYDAPGGDSTSHMKRDIGLAWLGLPLVTPSKARDEDGREPAQPTMTQEGSQRVK